MSELFIYALWSEQMSENKLNGQVDPSGVNIATRFDSKHNLKEKRQKNIVLRLKIYNLL